MLTAKEDTWNAEELSSLPHGIPARNPRQEVPTLGPLSPCLCLKAIKRVSFLLFVPKTHCASVSPLGSQGPLSLGSAQAPTALRMCRQTAEPTKHPHSLTQLY